MKAYSLLKESHIAKLPTETVYNALGHPFLRRLKTWRREAGVNGYTALGRDLGVYRLDCPSPYLEGALFWPQPQKSGGE